MEKLYYIGSYLSALLGVISVVMGVIGTIIGRTSPKFNIDDNSKDTLYEELNSELKRAKRRLWLYQIVYYSLSTISVIGGILISTVYFYETFTKQIGIMGFFILLSTLLMLFIRPNENYQRAKEDLIFLKKTERDYQCFDEAQKATYFLRKKLNEYDRITMRK